MNAFHFNHTSWNYIKRSANQFERLMSYEVAAVQRRYFFLINSTLNLLWFTMM